MTTKQAKRVKISNRKPKTTTPVTPSKPEDIHTKAMLVKVSISCWSARKFDRKVSEEVNASKLADRGAGRFNKHLLGGKGNAKSHAAVEAAGMAMRFAHYKQTLPWADDGWRLLPSANFFEYSKEMRAQSSRFEQAVATFVREYPELRKQAKQHLGDMFEERDYPTSVTNRFHASVEYSPIPQEGDFRLTLPDDEAESIKRTVTSRVERATKEAMEDAWNRLREAVTKVRDRLDNLDSVLRDSVLRNLEDMVDILGRLNVLGDPKLDEMRERIKSELAGLDSETLRRDKKARKGAAKKADEILTAMSAVFGGTPNV